jgi:RNA polymerase sigma factor (sigma-70 family)
MRKKQQEQQVSFPELAAEHRKALERFVRHVLEFAESRGDLVPGQLRPADVVDDTLILASTGLSRARARTGIREWLMDTAGKYIQAEVTRTTWERDRTVHLEEDIPETPPKEEVSTLGEEIFDFYQPDEDLTLEDVIPGIEIPTPEQEAERRELRRCVRSALDEMPGEWRRTLLLRHLHDLAGSRLAKAVGKSPREVDTLLDYAAGYLRRRLAEAGFVASGESRPAARSPRPAARRGS